MLLTCIVSLLPRVLDMLSHNILSARPASRQSIHSMAARSLSTASPQASSSSQPSSSSTNYYRITLRRSAIGLTEKTKGTLASLGLRKRLQSVYQPQRNDIAGMILAVKELVHVENVKRLDEDRAQEGAKLASTTQPDIWLNEKGEVVDWGGRQARKAPRGYTVVGNVSNTVRNEEILAMKKQGLS